MSDILAANLRAQVASDPSRLCLISSAGRWTYGELCALLGPLREGVRRWAARRVGLVLQPDGTTLAALAALEQAGTDTFLLRPETTREQLEEWCAELAIDVVLRGKDGGIEIALDRGAEAGSADGQGAVVILTSGTTGKPKAARHTWQTLTRPVRRDPAYRGTRWLSGYAMSLYAGLQVFSQSFMNGAALLILPTGSPPPRCAALLREWRPDFASATPSFWRHLLTLGGPDLRRVSSLRQITMGGEVATQDIIDRLRRTFPAARIVHIYATTELGRCFSVSDGLAGFPARFLDGPSPDGVLKRIEDGELYIRSTNAMTGYDARCAARGDAAGWLATGDLVEVQGDRVHFVGRRSDMINVGGHKVYPLEVERVIRAVDGVADVRVYGVRSSIVGQLVACDVVAADGADVDEVRRRLAQECANQLAEPQRPRRVQFVDAVAMSSAGKVVRGVSHAE